jgi:hypothetical protein
LPVWLHVDVMMDFTGPILRGVSPFHCHPLGLEDEGMTTKIPFN